MPRTHLPRRRPAPDAHELLGLLDGVDRSVVVGFAASRSGIDLYVHDIPPDARAGTAGLFGLVAPSSWCAAGVVLSGCGRSTVTGEVVGDDAVARVVLTRRGQLASTLALHPLADGAVDSAVGSAIDGGATGGDTIDGAATRHHPEPAGPVQGLAVDSLHRVLGLPSPGRAPALCAVITSVWFDDVLAAVADTGHVDWATAAALHPIALAGPDPLDPGRLVPGPVDVHPALGSPGAVPPSTEALVEATVRAASELDWERMRRRAAAGEFRAVELTAREAAWMDDVMFARWTTCSLPDEATVIEVVRAAGSDEAADGLSQVLAALERRGLTEPRVTTR
jgi:hypothetical protein